MTERTPPEFAISRVIQGYAHETITGTYTGDATAKDVADKFYHSYFGGRDAWARDGQFSVVRHTD